MLELERAIGQQEALAEFGEAALHSRNLDQILNRACRLVREALKTKCAKVLEICPAENALLVRAGVGWAAGVVGRERVPLAQLTSETFAIRMGEPVVTRDINTEKRFGIPPFMQEAGVVALVNVPILCPSGRAFGLLEVDDTRPREFGEDEIHFLRAYAAILGSAIDRQVLSRMLHEPGERYLLSAEVASDYSKRLARIGHEVSERCQIERQLIEGEKHFRQFADASSDVIWIRNAATLRFEYLSPACETVYGERREALLGGEILQRCVEIIHPDDREDVLLAINRVRAGERVDNTFRIIRPSDGELRWIENRIFPLLDEDSHVQLVGGLAKDVTEIRQAAARSEILVAELQHRSRNLLGVVAAVAAKTLGTEGPAADFQERLQALSRAQGLLSKFGSDTAEVGALLQAELDAHLDAEPPKVVLSGPKVKLTARQVQNFSLALHELATNAIKYGALREGVGRLVVEWRVARDEAGERRLILDWTEKGVSVPPGAKMRRGYGRHLIEKALGYALRAETVFELNEDGVHCRISLPLAE